ncbi:hypothetical protein BCR44DRAFT_1025146 [Catenaria anguillulae PL171]|uniref:MIF4G domain-containing protein n=1 Tax=Catenaria anguillulae PL171 TaxID=765915 RepID=A0A1Y2HX87_9FUNG|nr:hypothetical protein BCR44DRAFT_1025146 [Catenaria anguillulae PL171]
MPQMPQPQPQMQGYASSPSQLLAQMKAQQQQQQQPGVYPPAPTAGTTTATTPGSAGSSSAPAPYGQQQPSTNRPPPPMTTTNPPAATTSVSGMVLPQGVNVPQPQQPPVVQVQAAQPIPMPVPTSGAPPGMMPQLAPAPHMPLPPMGHSTSPPLLAHAQLGVPPVHSPVTASSPTPPLGAAPARPTIRIASKEDPTKTIQLTDLAIKASRSTSHRGSTAGLGEDAGDTASMATVSSVGAGTATTPDAAEPDKTQMGEGQLIAKRQVEENMRRGTKALEIKRPEHPRGGTPSPRPGSSPVVGKAALVKAPVAAVVADKTKEEIKARSRSRSKSPAKHIPADDIEVQGGYRVFKDLAKNGVEEHEHEVKRGRSKSPVAKPVDAVVVPKLKSLSPARRLEPGQQASSTTKAEEAPAAVIPAPRTPSPAKPRSPSPAKETKKEVERVPSPAPAPKEVKKERSPSPPKEQERTRSPSPSAKVGKSPARSKSPSPVRSGPSSPKNVPTTAETPEPERASSPARSTVSDLEEGEIRASPTSGEYPEVLQLADADENGVFRYSRSRLTELCLPDLPLPNGINLAVFADLRGSRGAGGYDARGTGGASRGGSASGSSRGGLRIGMPERAMSTPTPYQGSAPGSSVSTPTRERRPMPMPPGAAAAAAMAASSSGRSMSGRGESRRDGSRRGADREAASGDREKRGSRRGTKRTGTADEGSASSSSMSLPAQTTQQQPQLAVAGAALQPSERAHGARGVEVLPEDLKPLEKSSTAWVPESVLQKVAPGALPTPASADANLSEGELEAQRESEYCTQIEKQMRGVLNKLTPENIDRLQPRFAESLRYPSALKLICRLIVRKSFDEPKYASLYASLTLFMYHNIKPLEGMADDPEGSRLCGRPCAASLFMNARTSSVAAQSGRIWPREASRRSNSRRWSRSSPRCLATCALWPSCSTMP